MPFFQNAEKLDFANSTFVDVGRDQVIINNIQAKHHLPYADGASWSRTLTCLQGTRAELLNDIMKQVTAGNGEGRAQVVLLVDVAGSGKTAVANTIAQRCHEQGIVVSSFFFDREVAGRNGPEKLFSTIALDLAGSNKNFAKAIDLALGQQRSLASAPLCRQFDELILKPFQRYPKDKPVVIVIDALDESYGTNCDIHELLTILRDDVPKLPGSFSIFLTSRPLEKVDAFLAGKDHISRLIIDIHANVNREDITIYAQAQLKEVARLKKLGDTWPDEQLLKDFIMAAEGLFLWVATVCQYICTTVSPELQLRLLISRRSPKRITAEVKMDKLYLTILESCNWDDDNFVDGYKLIVGAIMAAKSPLSTQALQALHSVIFATGSSVQSHITGEAALHTPHQSLPDLHTDIIPQTGFQFSQIFRRFVPPLWISRPKSGSYAPFPTFHSSRALRTVFHSNLTVPVSAVLRPLGSLLTGLTDMEQPVRILHLSFRDFITIRAQLSPTSERFHLNEEEHSQRLALLCLLVLNKNLREGIPGTGYLVEDESVNQGIPEIPNGQISEEVWYACRFWPDHVVDSRIPVSPAFMAALRDLLSTKLVLWLEIVTAKGKFQNMRRVREWLQFALTNEVALIDTSFNSDLASCLFRLSNRLSYINRREEALDAIQEAVEIRRKLAMENPVAFTPSLAESLHKFSVYLSAMGHRDEALGINQEAAKIWQKLAMKQPEKYNPDLAKSLNNLANWLHDLGRKEEALDAVQQSVNIRRKLAITSPEKYNPDFSSALHTLSTCLSSTGREGEALDAIQHAVDIRRKLAAEHPAIYNPMLAKSLICLYSRLFELNRRDEAPTAIHKAVEILQQLVEERPAAFDSDLAISLHNFSHHLSAVGRREEALDAIQRAVAIWQKLATERPTVFNSHLADSLFNLSQALSVLGRYEEALGVIQETVQIRRGLAAQYPLVFKPKLTESLKHRSYVNFHLSRLSKEEEARVSR